MLKYRNGDLYEGEFKNDKKTDEGICKSKGIGVYTWANKETYKGHWENDKKSGKGRFCVKP
jgi:hypothetical protein